MIPRRTLSGDTLTLPVLAGDGIGPEITEATLEVFDRASRWHGITFVPESLPVGLTALEQQGCTVPEQTLRRLDETDAAVLGPLTTHVLDPNAGNQPNGSALLRKRFRLGANIRPASSVFGAPNAFGEVDLVVVRENTQGFYADRNMVFGQGEFQPADGVALSVRVITADASEDVARVAFETAVRRARHSGRAPRVTAVHKANVLRVTDGIFLDAVHRVAADFPEVAVDSLHVDAAATELIMQPRRFDVLVTTNMFGDILSNESAALVGGLGFAPSLNRAADGSFALAQASHGSAPDIAGSGTANPIALILSVSMLFDWLADTYDDPRPAAIASDVNKRVAARLRDGGTETLRTADIARSLTN